MRISKRFFRALLTSTGWWLGFAASVLLFLLVQQIVENEGLASFEYHVENAQLAVRTRVRSYVDVLRGANALFYSKDQISRDEFHDYVTHLNLEQSFPGITNLNVARQIHASEKKAFEVAIRADTSLHANGYPNFAVTPPGERSEYHVLTYIEPMDVNLVSFGFDIASNAYGAQALALSRDSGQLYSSGKLIHIRGPNSHFALAMRMPLYHRGMPIDTVEQRRAAYYGSVGAGFDIHKLMQGVIDKNKLGDMRIRLFDVGTSDGAPTLHGETADTLLFDSAAAAGDTSVPPPEATGRNFIKRVTMAVGPRVWDMEFSVPRAAAVTHFDGYLPWMVSIGCLIASTLLFGVYYSLSTARRRAIELAKEMTKDLRASEASLAEAQHMARLGSWVFDPHAPSMSWSAETFRILGIDRFTVAADYDTYLKCIPENDRQRVREGFEKCLATGDGFDTEHRVLRADGSIRWVQTICRPGHTGDRKLLRGTIMDITERKQTVEALKRSRELLRDLTAHQDRVKEEERKRIAREIHDELGQTLLALRIDVSMLEARTARAHPRLNDKVRGALNQIDATVKTIRTIINNLRPAVLDLGLNAAIEWQVAQFRRRSGISCDLFMGDKEFKVDDARATSLFRILQESLTNVIRHANASHVVIDLYQEDDHLVMTISDNGVGIYPETRKPSNSFGLVGVEERIHALNGKFQITSAPGEGTTLTIYIPLGTESEEPPFNVVDSTR